MPTPHINPNKRRAKVENYINLPLDQQKEMYPDFISEIRLNKFRHLSNLTIPFRSPITVISGSNKTGKSSILLSIGCSHFNFFTKNAISGEYERTKWSGVMRFTSHDQQNEDWTYELKCREHGGDTHSHPGKRNYQSKKWSGCAKKEGQIGTPGPNIDTSPDGRHVYLLDLERIIPGRHLPPSIYEKVKGAPTHNLNNLVNLYLSYILENRYTAYELGGIGERKIYAYVTANKYSTFNSASGEDVLTKLLIDIINAPDNSLILIEEIEIGLHPKIQRRLMDILFCESSRAKKQFIITTHSPSIIGSVNANSRILLYKRPDDSIAVKTNVSINGALSSMDSESYPLLSIYVEDDVSKRLVQEAIQLKLPVRPDLRKIVKIVETGAADKAYGFFQIRKNTKDSDNLKRGFACVLDGDKRNEKYKDGSLQYPAEEGLFFHYSNEAPERMLLKTFLSNHHNDQLIYHADQSHAHVLMQKMVDEGFAASQDAALSICIDELKNKPEGQQYFEELSQFIIDQCDKFETEM